MDSCGNKCQVVFMLRSKIENKVGTKSEMDEEFITRNINGRSMVLAKVIPSFSGTRTNSQFKGRATWISTDESLREHH